jgi:hypothetical protein
LPGRWRSGTGGDHEHRDGGEWRDGAGNRIRVGALDRDRDGAGSDLGVDRGRGLGAVFGVDDGASGRADERYGGSALAFQTGIGFLLTAVTIRTVPVLEDQWGWGVAFALLALGPEFGVLSMQLLRRSPEAALLAGGRR